MICERCGNEMSDTASICPACGTATSIAKAERQGPWKIPGGPLTETDFKKAAQDGGFTGNIIVGTDLASVRLPAK